MSGEDKLSAVSFQRSAREENPLLAESLLRVKIRAVPAVKMAGGMGTHVHYAIDVPNGEKVPGNPEKVSVLAEEDRGGLRCSALLFTSSRKT